MKIWILYTTWHLKTEMVKKKKNTVRTVRLWVPNTQLKTSQAKWRGVIRRYWGGSQGWPGHRKGTMGTRLLSVHLSSLYLCTLMPFSLLARGLWALGSMVIDSPGLYFSYADLRVKTPSQQNHRLTLQGRSPSPGWCYATTRSQSWRLMEQAWGRQEL